MKRLIFHIGQPKTGSTSLQYFLAANRLALARRGIAYPSHRGSSLTWQNQLRHRTADLLLRCGVSSIPAAVGWERNHSNLAYEIGYSRDSKERFSPRRLTFDTLQDFVLDCTEDTIIVSSESLLYYKRLRDRMMPLAQAVTRAGTDIEIVCFLRPQHRLINSFYAQVTKRLTNALPFAAFCDHYLSKRHRPAGTKLKDWCELPRSTVKALPFTRNRLQPNIETVFFRALDLDRRVDDLLRTCALQNANESPGPMTIEACRRAALALTTGGTRLPRGKRRELSKAIIAAGERQGWNATKFDGIDQDRRKRIHDAYADDNEKVARHFWGASWRDVFADDYDGACLPNEIARGHSDEPTNRLIDAAVRECAASVGITLPALSH